jgi:DNA-binding NarL/FixJ family response regulator
LKLAAVRVLIVDDSQPWRCAVCLLLKQNLDLVLICECSDGLEAVRKSEDLQPDLVLLDIGLPNLNGLEAARQIRKVSPGSRILFLTSYDGPEFLREALSIGALGFVVKSHAASDLLPAVRAVMQGQQFFDRGH